jgi:uncharacterized RDD family membrane protein YckC
MIDAAVARQASLPPHEPLLHESRTRPATEDPSAARPEPPAQFEAKPVLQARPALKPNPVPAQEPPLKPEPAPKPEPRLPLDIRPPVRVIPEPAPKPEPRLPPDMRPPVRVIPEPEPIPSPFPALLPEPREDKLILLTRTLAGLVDFIVVVLCAGLMILAVDILEGIDVFDTVSRIHYGVLFLLMYFVYSIFFLAMAGQTIGMMLTDVRMIGASSERVSLPRILIRCFVFLAGVAAAGIGLLWGCFDGEARCLHDLMSRTKVIRVLQDI